MCWKNTVIKDEERKKDLTVLASSDRVLLLNLHEKTCITTNLKDCIFFESIEIASLSKKVRYG